MAAAARQRPVSWRHPPGTAVGLVAENGDPTHNFFGTPGNLGLSSSFQVAEVNGGSNESLFISGAAIGCTGDGCVMTVTPGVPEVQASVDGRLIYKI